MIRFPVQALVAAAAGEAVVDEIVERSADDGQCELATGRDGPDPDQLSANWLGSITVELRSPSGTPNHIPGVRSAIAARARFIV